MHFNCGYMWVSKPMVLVHLVQAYQAMGKASDAFKDVHQLLRLQPKNNTYKNWARTLKDEVSVSVFSGSDP